MASSSLANGTLREASFTNSAEPGEVMNGSSTPHPHSAPGVMPIAVVGMACRFPGGSSNPEKLWDMLEKKRSGWSEIPAERFTQRSFQGHNNSVAGTYNPQGAHFLQEDVSLFDATAFSISPLEAKAMDPQMRLLLEVTYESIENGGITLEQIAGSKTGVYIGVFGNDYSDMMLSDPESLPAHHVTGTGKAIFANRISYFFDLKGPSFSLDTGCSASLVALHQACQSIRCGESKQAIVGGTNLILSPKTMISLGGLGFLSDHGRCYSFDTRGSGYGRGEGVASIVIKPLKDAIAHGDPIRAVIRNTVLNQDGRTPGLTMPSGKAQAELIENAYEQAGLDPLDTHYVEAHGTGTQAGDPIEAEAIATALSAMRDPSKPLILGSVKTNVGHLESASGLAGLLKAVLCLEKSKIPPSINFETENVHLHLQEKSIRVATELESWPSGCLRRASLNSFGYGGANAHVILDAYDRDAYKMPGTQPSEANGTLTDSSSHDQSSSLFPPESCCTTKKLIFLISHRTKVGVGRVAEDLKTYCTSVSDSGRECFLDNMAYTLNSRRTVYSWRAAVTAATQQELTFALGAPTLEPQRSLQNQRISFIFTGQGAQWHAMGRELIDSHSIFRSVLNVSDKYFKNLGSSWSLMDELLKPAETSRVNSAAVGQPLCTAIQCALVELLKSWNIKPTAVMGHSSGEIAAAYACESLALESALLISYHRGLLASTRLERNSKLRGAMLAANVSETEAERYIRRVDPSRGRAVVACVNSPGSVTLSGDRPAIVSIQNMFEARQIFARRLRVGTAYHSHHMDLVADGYLDALQNLPSSGSTCSSNFFSTVTGDRMRGVDLDARYWVKNMVSQVKFSPCLEKLHEATTQFGISGSGEPIVHTVLEVGPHGALAGFVKQTLGGMERKVFRHLSTLSRGKNAIDTMFDMASRLVVSGYPINLEAVNNQNSMTSRPADLSDSINLQAVNNQHIGHPPSVLTDLPTYPWDHATSHWHESRLSIEYRKRTTPPHPLLGTLSPDFNLLEPSWRNIIRVSAIPWISGHVVQSNILFPAAGYVAMAVEASIQRSLLIHGTKPIKSYRLRNIVIDKPLIIPKDTEGVETKFVLRPYNRSAHKSSNVWDEFRLFSYTKSIGWSDHSRGLISVSYHQDHPAVENEHQRNSRSAHYARSISMAQATCTNVTNPVRLYESLNDLGLEFQGTFRCIEDVAVSDGQSLGHIKIPNTALMMPGGIEHPHLIHPTTLDACMQMTSPILMNAGMLQAPMVPTFIKEIHIDNDLPKEAGDKLLVHTTIQLKSKRSLKADITANRGIAPLVGLPVIDIQGLECTAIPGGTSSLSPKSVTKCHQLRWEICPQLTPHGESAPINGFSTGAETMGKVSFEDFRGKNLQQVTLIQPGSPSSTSKELISWLSSTLGESLVRVTSDFDELIDGGLHGKICLCLIEIDSPVLKNCTASQWNALRQMLSSTGRVLWITKGGTKDVHLPDAGLITGLARTARMDNPALRFITYDIASKDFSPRETADLITTVLVQSFGHVADNNSLRDVEFTQVSQRIYVPRVVEAETLQIQLASNSTEPQVSSQKFFSPGRSLRLEVVTPGRLDNLQFTEDTTSLAPLAPQELRMQPRAYGVNFRDVMIALGQLEDTSRMSCEHSGVVTEVGDALRDEFSVGDRICAWGGTAYAGSVTLNGNAVQRIPEDMSFETASSIPIVYATVFYGLIHVARLQKGESVLIHSAAGGVGQAAVMLAKHIGANIIVTVGSNEKKRLLMEVYGIPEHHIFSSRQLSFANGVKALTANKGVDVVLNSLAGEAFHETFECMARLGRFIEIGKRDILANSRLDMAMFNQSVTFASVDLGIVFEHDPTLAKRMISEVFDLLAAGSLQPVQPLNVYPLSELEDAFRLIQAGKHTGKVVLQVNHDTTVKAHLRPTHSTRFLQEASYVLIGGLGGLGRALCRWMVSRGCKNIIVLSRTGGKSVHAASVKDELEVQGVRLAIYECDVGDRAQVNSVLGLCALEMPPIKGVIHSAMVIRDNIIDKMTLENYHAALRPKVQGTLNIHEALLSNSTPLDFFIMLSSCVGIIGSNGQANYASACTYQDAFARYRTINLGLPTRSINLGMVEDAGYVSESEEAYRFLTAQGYRGIKADELFSLIDYAISHPVIDNVDDCQLMIGLTNSHEKAQNSVSFADAKFSHIRLSSSNVPSSSSAAPSSSLLARIRTAASASDSEMMLHSLVRDAIIAQVGKVLVVPLDDISASQSISHYGGDSLSAVELRNWFAQSMEVAVGVMEILGGKSIDGLTRDVLARRTTQGGAEGSH